MKLSSHSKFPEVPLHRANEIREQESQVLCIPIPESGELVRFDNFDSGLPLREIEAPYVEASVVAYLPMSGYENALAHWANQTQARRSVRCRRDRKSTRLNSS